MSSTRRLIITISILAFVSSLGACISYDVKSAQEQHAFYQEQEYNRANGGIVFAGPYCFPDPHPKLLYKIVFLTLLPLVFLVFLRDPAWAFPASLLSFGIYPYWYWSTQRDLAMAEYFEVFGIDQYLLRASGFDIATLLLTTTLTGLLFVLATRSIRSYFVPPKLS